MSISVNLTEKLTIINKNDDAKRLLMSLKEYLDNIMGLVRIESLYIKTMELTVDGKTAIILDKAYHSGENIFSVEKKDDGNITDKLEEQETKNKIFHDDNLFLVLHSKISDAHEVELFACYSCTRLMGGNYGYAFWTDKIRLNKSLYGLVTYKCLEYYDCSPAVTLYQFNVIDGKQVNGSVPLTKDLSYVSDIEDWYDWNFNSIIYFPAVSEKRELLLERMKKLLKYDANGNAKIEDFEENGEISYELNMTVSIKNSQVTELVGQLNKMASIVKDENGRIDLHCSLIPDKADDFASLWIVIEDDSVIAKAARY